MIEKKYASRKKKLCNSLEIGEKVLVLAEMIKKNQHLENFISKQFKTYRISTKKTVFTIRRKQNIDKKAFYWLKNEEKNQY